MVSFMLFIGRKRSNTDDQVKQGQLISMISLDWNNILTSLKFIIQQPKHFLFYFNGWSHRQ